MDGGALRSLIWIIEDDDDLRDALEVFLEGAGFDIASFENGARAWAALLRGERLPRAIVLDKRMPVMDGLEFRRLQCADPRFANIPVILYTADGPVECPGVLVVSKAVSGDFLVSALDSLCAPRRLDVAHH